jgi:hypothetical protein
MNKPWQTPFVGTLSALLLAGSTASAELCYTDSSGKDGPFYDGPSASYMYDDTFRRTNIRLGHFDSHIPQGAATWSNWNSEQDLLLFTAYSAKGGRPFIMAFEPKSTKHIGTVSVSSQHESVNHAGGIAVFEKLGWAFMSGPERKDGQSTVVSLSLKKLKQTIKDNGVIAPESETVVTSASFLTSHGPTDTLWVGHHSPDKLGTMEAYKVGADGELTALSGRWEVPKKTQGLVVTKDLFVYSTSLGNDNRSNIYVVRRGKNEGDLSRAKLVCFRAPSMAEGMTVYGNKVFLIFESAADHYVEKKPRNVIPHAHQASLAKLESWLR